MRDDYLELRQGASELQEYSNAKLERVTRYLGVLADKSRKQGKEFSSNVYLYYLRLHVRLCGSSFGRENLKSHSLFAFSTNKIYMSSKNYKFTGPCWSLLRYSPGKSPITLYCLSTSIHLIWFLHFQINLPLKLRQGFPR